VRDETAAFHETAIGVCFDVDETQTKKVVKITNKKRKITRTKYLQQQTISQRNTVFCLTLVVE
jgi:hypothetical protein